MELKVNPGAENKKKTPKSECECALCLHRALHGRGSAFLVMDGAEVSVLGREYSQMSQDVHVAA